MSQSKKVYKVQAAPDITQIDVNFENHVDKDAGPEGRLTDGNIIRTWVVIIEDYITCTIFI
jgi:hypothetical protein